MTKKYVFSVQSLSQPLRLDSFLSKQEEFLSRSQVQNLIKKQQVLVNGQKAKASMSVKNDDEISKSERRKLSKFPELSVNTVLSAMSALSLTNSK